MLGRIKDYAELVWRRLVWLELSLWGVWARLVNRLPESLFSPPPAPVEMPVLEKPTNEEIEGFKESIERRKVFHEETSKTIRRILYTLIATCLFCVVTLSGTSDVHLLAPNSTVKLPVLNYDMSFVGFLVVGPVVLIGLTSYLHIFLGQHLIATVPIEERFAMLVNFEGGASRLATILLLYWMVPFTLTEFAWKAKPRPGGFEIYIVACVIATGLSYLQFRRCPKELRTRGIALLLCAVVLYLSYTTVRIWNRHLSLFKADLNGQDLRGANLESAFLAEANLENTNLRMAKLQGADLSLAKLQGADLRYAYLQGADLLGARLQGANFSDAYLQGADLSLAKLQGADLSYAKLQGADLSYAKLQGADLSNAKLQGADLSDAKLQESDLLSAELQGADLSDAKLQGADLSDAKLHESNLLGAELQGADLSDAKLQGANLSLAKLQGANLLGAELQRADLRLAELQGADLRMAKLQGADLRMTKLQGANLLNAELQRADLRLAELQGADLSDAMLQGANFSLANLSTPVPYKYHLTGESLKAASNNIFPWPLDTRSGAFYEEGKPPIIDPSLLVYFTTVGDECTWVKGIYYSECAGSWK